jgi:hypothetical protein
MEVSSQLQAPSRFIHVERIPVPTGQEAGWAPELVWELWRRENSLAAAGNQTPIPRSSKYNMEAAGSYKKAKLSLCLTN